MRNDSEIITRNTFLDIFDLVTTVNVLFKISNTYTLSYLTSADSISYFNEVDHLI